MLRQESTGLAQTRLGAWENSAKDCLGWAVGSILTGHVNWLKDGHSETDSSSANPATSPPPLVPCAVPNFLNSEISHLGWLIVSFPSPLPQLFSCGALYYADEGDFLEWWHQGWGGVFCFENACF